MTPAKLSLFVLSLLVAQITTAQIRFENINQINVPDIGPASLYPSTIEVSGLPPYLQDISVVIPQAFYVGDYEELDMLLESPDGQQFLLMSDVDLGPFFGLFTDLTFSLEATQRIDRQTADSRQGFLPSNYGSDPDTLPAPGPGIVRDLPHHFYPLEGINPNGSWKLYLYNSRENMVSGTLDQGWALTLSGSEVPICPRLISPRVDETSITARTAQITWGSYTNNEYEVYYAPNPVPVPNNETTPTLTNLSDTTLMLIDLLPNVSYTLYVRSNCGNSAGPWQGPVSFEMEEECPTSLPIIETCTVYDIDDFPVILGWDMEEGQVQDLSDPQFAFSYTPPITGTYALEDISSVEGETLGRIAFQVEDGSCNEKEGWDYYSLNDKVQIPELVAGTSYRFIYQTPQLQVQLRISPCQSTLFLSAPNLLAGPYAFKPQLLENGERATGSFEFYYSPATLPAPDFDTPPLEIVDDIQIDQMLGGNLLPETDYHLYIRRVCGEQIGCWSKPIPFRTEPDCGQLNYLGQNDTTATTTALRFKAENAVPVWIFEYGETPFEAGNGSFTFSGEVENDTILLELEALQPNQDYQLYYTPSCSASGLNPTYGPIDFSTNSDCNALATPISCGATVENRFQSGDGTPLVATGSCAADRTYASKMYQFTAGQTGTVTLQFAGFGGSSESQASFSYADADLGCGNANFTAIGCWERNGNNYPNLFIPVEAGKSYFILSQVYNVTGPAPFALFSFQLNNCGFLPGTCPAISTLVSEAFANDNIRLSWPGVYAECYDILYGPLAEELDTLTMTPQQNCWPNPFFVIDVPNPGTPYQFYVRSRCGEEVTPWQWGRYPNGQFQIHEVVGELYFCAPYVTQEGQSRSFVTQSFTTDVAGAYQWNINVAAAGPSRFLIYENSIAPENLVSTTEGVTDFQASASLAANTEYISMLQVATPATDAFVELYMTIFGPDPFANLDEISSEDQATAAGQIPLTENWETATYNCLGADNWRHYYYDNQTPANRSDDHLLLSIQDYPALNQAEVKVSAGGSSGASLITNPPASYLQNESGIVIMNRYWQVDMPNTAQPDSPVQVRFYWHNDDFDQIQMQMEALDFTLPNDFNELFFYKINGDYNPNPVDGHAAIPAATVLAADGYWEYYYSEERADNAYQTGTHIDGNPFVQFPVAVFSGGGGGAAADGEGALLVDVSETDAPAGYWQVFPNPTSNFIYLKQYSDQTHYNLWQSQGQLISQGQFPREGLALGNLSPGVYFLGLSDKQYTGRLKLMVLR